MDRRKALELLKQALNRTTHLIELKHDNRDFELWKNEVCDILEVAFGKNSTEYVRFAWAVTVTVYAGSDIELQERYIEDLNAYETALESIIRKHKILGTEGERGKGGEVEKMEKQKAFELLKECLAELEHLRSLNHDNEKQYDWRDKFIAVLEAAFGKNSDEYKKLNTLPPVPIHKSDKENQKEYLRDLTRYETIVKQIIQKMYTTDIPKYLFDSMQFHPKVIEASGKLFKDGHYRDAIYRAFVEVNNFVKDKANSQLDGRRLMSTVFSLDNPIIKLNPLKTQSDKDEQEGFMFLFMGAMEGIRNPKAHENIIQNDQYKALEYLSFASLLMQTIDFWEVEKT